MATTTTTSTAIASQPARATAGPALPTGMLLFVGLMASLAATIALAFWLARDIHTTAPLDVAPVAAE